MKFHLASGLLYKHSDYCKADLRSYDHIFGLYMIYTAK